MVLGEKIALLSTTNSCRMANKMVPNTKQKKTHAFLDLNIGHGKLEVRKLCV